MREYQLLEILISMVEKLTLSAFEKLLTWPPNLGALWEVARDNIFCSADPPIVCHGIRIYDHPEQKSASFQQHTVLKNGQYLTGKNEINKSITTLRV